MIDAAALQTLTAAWALHMRRGDFEAAWNISDALLRARAGESCSHLLPECRWVWDGTPLTGKRVLVRCYRGLGDTIQFVRYLPLLKRVAAETIVSTQPELMPLVSTVAGVDRVIEEEYGTPAVCHDAQVEVMELPFIFRTTLADVPADVPYIHLAPMLLDTNRFSVGLVWQSGEWDTRRSIPFPLVEPLQQLPGITWYIVQRGPGLDEWDGRMGVLSPAATIAEQGRVIRALDLMISVDSMPSHLAGALGVPTWILLHTEADWRWMEKRADSPWYPHARLFRQQRAGDWEPVIARVREELGGR